MKDKIKQYCTTLSASFELISMERKANLEQISTYVRNELMENKNANLVYVCTHNSRRSHFGQIWAQVAADFYGIKKINTFSAGTERTALHPNAIEALKELGFEVNADKKDEINPNYHVEYGGEKEIVCYSKTIDEVGINAKEKFIAIMTCSDAEENCPYIPQAELKIATTYEDPKKYDGTPIQLEKYLERSEQIARECLYVFYRI